MYLEVRKWTVAEYHHMAEVGILNPDERVELLEGQIVKMAAKGTLHTVAVRLTVTLLESLLQGLAQVHSQDPIVLNDLSEPEPDIAVVQVDSLLYLDHHPTPSEIYLLIEVADTTIKQDCEVKGKLYAANGIADYWVLDVKNRQLSVFREPGQNGYETQLMLREEMTISPLQFPTLNIEVQAMLPPFF